MVLGSGLVQFNGFGFRGVGFAGTRSKAMLTGFKPFRVHGV